MVNATYRKECRQCEREHNNLLVKLRKTAPPKPEVCDLCHQPGKLVLDHDHKTLEFRGWIHSGCNLGIARFGDNLQGVEKAYRYLLERQGINMWKSQIKQGQGHNENSILPK